MSENMWTAMQIFMWGFGIQTAILIAILTVFYTSISNKFQKTDNRFDKIDNRFDKIEERMTRMENDMIEVKTILRMKECCMITDDRQTKKAE